MNLQFSIRLLVAGILGAVIGLDRELRSKEAGIRTHFLVSLGSALIMIVSQYGFAQIASETKISLDPSRIAAQVVSGIGFIGAGTIIVQKRFVHGLTTAAGVWTTSGVGLAIGSGMFLVGICGTILTLLGLELPSIFLKSRKNMTIAFNYSSINKTSLHAAFNLFDHDDVLSYSVKTGKDKDSRKIYYVSLVVRSTKTDYKKQKISQLQKLDEVVINLVE
ncbi:methyltransferase [Sporolactobacillus sp. THM19-2]|nr:methyltransferase [Sporolactobacillus sp. THM19-2]